MVSSVQKIPGYTFNGWNIHDCDNLGKHLVYLNLQENTGWTFTDTKQCCDVYNQFPQYFKNLRYTNGIVYIEAMFWPNITGVEFGSYTMSGSYVGTLPIKFNGEEGNFYVRFKKNADPTWTDYDMSWSVKNLNTYLYYDVSSMKLVPGDKIHIVVLAINDTNLNGWRTSVRINP